MKEGFLLLKKYIHIKINHLSRSTALNLHNHWFEILLVATALFLLANKDLSIDFKMDAIYPSAIAESVSLVDYDGQSSPLNISTLSGKKNTDAIPKATNASLAANTYSNMTYSSRKNSEKEKALKKKKQLAYVNRFAKIAQTEMGKYGIPASIKLAQGLIESNAGESRLSKKNNNHFGIKCFSKSCKKGHCSNFSDDTHKDFFRIYSNTWESYRAHSQLLNSKRYKPLYRLKSTDYKGWAKGLKKAGYATDKRYAEKLIQIIEDLKLYKYDK